MNRIRTSAYCVVAALLVCRAYAFDTIINIDSFNLTAPTFIGSNTQLNVTKTGRMPLEFQAGAADGSSVNVEFNFSAIRAEKIDAYAGSVLNFADGSVWDKLTAHDGSIVNVFDTTRLFDFVIAENGGTINVYGGTLLYLPRVEHGGNLNVFGGSVHGGLVATDGAKVKFSGGTFGDAFQFLSGSEFQVCGTEFTLNGQTIVGLTHPGDSAAIDLPPNSVISGTLADGTPFAFSDQDGDFIADGSLELIQVTVPNAAPEVIDVVGESSLAGIRSGQRLIVHNGGKIADRFTAGAGSTVDIKGGEVGFNFEAVYSRVNVSGGEIGSYFDAFYGASVNISDGVFSGSLGAANGSVVRFIGGEVRGSLLAKAGSYVSIAGGTFGDGFQSQDGATVRIHGGEFGKRFFAFDGTDLTIAGGTFGDDFRGYGGSNIKFRGSEFLLDGVPIEGLVPGMPTLITQRDVDFTGLYPDGSPFSFELNSTDYEHQKGYYDPYWRPYDLFAAEALVSVTLVPEPSVCMIGTSFLGMVLLIRHSRDLSASNLQREPKHP